MVIDTYTITRFFARDLTLHVWEEIKRSVMHPMTELLWLGEHRYTIFSSMAN